MSGAVIHDKNLILCENNTNLYNEICFSNLLIFITVTSNRNLIY